MASNGTASGTGRVIWSARSAGVPAALGVPAASDALAAPGVPAASDAPGSSAASGVPAALGAPGSSAASDDGARSCDGTRSSSREAGGRGVSRGESWRTRRVTRPSMPTRPPVGGASRRGAGCAGMWPRREAARWVAGGPRRRPAFETSYGLISAWPGVASDSVPGVAAAGGVPGLQAAGGEASAGEAAGGVPGLASSVCRSSAPSADRTRQRLSSAVLASAKRWACRTWSVKWTSRAVEPVAARWTPRTLPSSPGAPAGIDPPA
jgi:hypothetical protein